MAERDALKKKLIDFVGMSEWECVSKCEWLIELTWVRVQKYGMVWHLGSRFDAGNEHYENQCNLN